MLVATLLLSAMLSPQAPAPAAEELPPEAPATDERPEAPPLAAEAMDAPAAPAGEVAAHIGAGLDAFRKRRFSRARDEFEKAVAADPMSAPAAFYLGYVHYKLAEPSRRLTAEKQQAKDLFAKAYALDPTFQPVWGQKP